MPAHNANSRAAALMKAWNFPNNYTLSKHLAEYMVADYQRYCKLPIAIARPALISSVARDPYPGEPGCCWGCTWLHGLLYCCTLHLAQL